MRKIKEKDETKNLILYDRFQQANLNYMEKFL